MSVKKYLTLNGLTYFFNKIKTYLTSSTYLNSIGISNSDIDDIADDAGYSSGSLPASEDIFITGDIIPNTDNSVDVGASSKNIKMIYTKGITINGKTPANDDDVVHKSGNETISGTKTFSNGFTVNKPSPRLQTKSTTYSSETTSGMTVGDIAFLNNSGGFSSWILDQLRDNLTKRLCFRVYPHAGGAYKGFAFDENCTLYAENTNSALGTFANKWKTINGINPGALSLPSTTGLINIASSITALDGVTVNSFTPQVDGWLILNGTSALNDGFIYAHQGRIGASSTANSAWYRCVILLPVVAGVEVSVICKLNAITWANIVPCRGNV